MCTWLPLLLMLGASLFGWLIGRSREFDTSGLDSTINTQKLELSNLTKKNQELEATFAAQGESISSLKQQLSVQTEPTIKEVEVVKEVPVEVIKEVPVEVVKEVEVIKEIPVEVIKEVESIREVEVIKEVPVEKIVEVIKEVEIIKEVPVEIIKEVEKIVEKEVQVEVIKEVEKIVEVEVIKEVPVERIVEVPVTKEVAVTKEVQVIKEVEVTREVPVEKIVEIEVIKEIIKEVPVEVIKEVEVEVEVIKEVPVEIVKEVEVIKQIDFNTLKQMMENMGTIEVSRNIVTDTKTRKDDQIVEVDRRRAKPAAIVPPTPEPEPEVVPEPEPEVVAEAPAEPDDLKKIEGIGPKLSQILIDGGIKTYVDLASKTPDEIRAVLQAAGPRYQMHNPLTWPDQARLAAAGKWDELTKLQDKLSGGL